MIQSDLKVPLIRWDGMYTFKCIKERSFWYFSTPCLFICLLMISTVRDAEAGGLYIGNPVRDGAYYTIPILLQTQDTGVAAMDFRLQYDPTVFTPQSTEAGSIALNAGKMVSANMTQPGEYVVVLMGLNRDTLASGEVARIVLEAVTLEGGESSQLTIADPTLATWEGQEIPSHGESRWVQVGDGANNDAPEPEQPSEPDNGNTDTDPNDAAYQPPEWDSTSTDLPTGIAGNDLGEIDAAITSHEDADSEADELQRMATNIARSATEAMRLRDQLQTPGTGTSWPDAQIADTRDTLNGGLSETDATQDSINNGTRTSPETAGAITDPQSENATQEDAVAQESRQRVLTGLKWFMVGLFLLFALLLLGFMRRRLLD